MVKPPPNHTSPPSTAATFLTTHLMVMLQPSRYSVFHSRDTPIQLGLPWQSYFCQCLNTETSAWGNRDFVKIANGGLHSFSFSLFYLIFLFFSFLFYFLFLEQLGLGVISHAVTSVTNWWHSHKTNHRTWENGVEGTRIKWRHTAWTTHASLM